MIGGTVGGAGNIRATTPEMRETAAEEARRVAAKEEIARLEAEAEEEVTRVKAAEEKAKLLQGRARTR